MSDHNHHSGFGFNLLQSVVISLAIIVALLCAVILGSQAYIARYHTYVLGSTSEAHSILNKNQRTAIVFGSGIDPQGNPRPILKQRLDAAVELYQADAVDQILVSGYHPASDYNEPAAMERYLLKQNIPADGILTDDSGTNTYATCDQAHNKFDVKEAILVTQPSHLDRAIYLCRANGVESYGYPAEQAKTQNWQYVQSIREAVGNVKAILNVHVPSSRALD